jgi:hypothetical protein
MGRFADGLKKTYSSVKKYIQKKIPPKQNKSAVIQEKYNSFQSRIPAIKNGVKTGINERQGGGKGEPGVPPKEPEQEGLTYMAVNECIPFQMKCGEHHKSFDIENRLKTLNCTSVPENFKPVCVVKSKHCTEIERKIHQKFSKYRINSRREFFGFKIGTMTSSTDFDYIKRKYEKLLAKMVKKMHKYAAQYGGEIIL